MHLIKLMKGDQVDMQINMKGDQVDMQRALGEAMKANADLKRKKSQLEADYKEQQDQFKELVG